MKKLVKEILDYEYHRNGINGVGFYVIMFSTTDDQVLMATLFPTAGHCSVLDIFKNPLNQKYRGDCYEKDLRKALKEKDKAKYADPDEGLTYTRV